MICLGATSHHTFLSFNSPLVVCETHSALQEKKKNLAKRKKKETEETKYSIRCGYVDISMYDL